ncbi:MFS transporter [Actinoplanes cyaneus]|uniref:MFS transporter n=1 Tax=Actinoplanes cyaneus TaxID=52696 RepID=A0A919MC51_9ACTN|nr:MFS transporter [Actinoplanes cyaneus]GID70309.1 MFS transporter [Actinoplanes cyaneus]
MGIGLTQPYSILFLHSVRGIPVAVATAMMALGAVTSLVGNPLAGTLIDRWGARVVMVAGLAVAGCGMLMLAFGRGTVVAATGVAVIGLGWSLFIPALATRLATLTPARIHQRVYTLQYVLFNIGMAAGAAVAGVVLARVTPDSATGRSVLPLLWVAAALTCMVGIVLVAVAGPAAATRPEAGPAGGYRSALADRQLLRVLGAAVLLSTVGYGIYEAAPSVLAFAAHDPAALSWLSVANCVMVIAGAPVAWRLTERISARVALLGTAVLWALAWAICVPTALGTGLPTRPALICAAVLTAAGELLIAGALPTLVNAIAPESLRGRYNALSSLSLTTGMAAGPLLTSGAAATGAIVALLCAAVVLATAAGLLLCRPARVRPAVAAVPGAAL